jgi:hypothetical protein
VGNGLAPHRENRELGLLVVVAGMVTKRAFEHDFGKSGHAQFTAQRFHQCMV